MLVQSPDFEQGEQLLGIPKSSGLGKKGILYERHYIVTFCLYFRSQSNQCNLWIAYSRILCQKGFFSPKFAYDHYCQKKNLPLRSLSRSGSVLLLRVIKITITTCEQIVKKDFALDFMRLGCGWRPTAWPGTWWRGWPWSPTGTISCSASRTTWRTSWWCWAGTDAQPGGGHRRDSLSDCTWHCGTCLCLHTEEGGWESYSWDWQETYLTWR